MSREQRGTTEATKARQEMGFFASYRRLSRRARIILGLVGVAMGLAGPYVVPSFPVTEKSGEKPDEKDLTGPEVAPS